VAILLVIQFTGILVFSLDIIPKETDSLEYDKVGVEFFFKKDCDTCKEVYPNIYEIEDYYKDNITVFWLNYTVNKERFYNFGCKTTPCVVVRLDNNFSQLDYEEISTENIMLLVNQYITNTSGTDIELESRNVIDTPFGSIDFSDMSLPILTVVLGGIDSVNQVQWIL